MLNTGRKAPRKVSFTDLGLKALKPSSPGARETVWDALLPGHAVRISAKGQKSFYAVRRLVPTDPNPVWYRLGTYPAMSLSQAREAAREALTALGEQRHPKTLAEAVRQSSAQAAREADEQSFAAVAEEFIAKYLPTIKSAKKYESYIRRELLPVLGNKPTAGIRRRDVIALLETIAERSGKGAAVGTLAVLRQLLNRAVDRDIIDVNPAAAVKPASIIGKAEARDRLISDAELPVLWRAIDAVGEPFATVYRVLLLTGARREEIGAARWSEFDEKAGTLEVPGERTKNGKPNLIALPPLAEKLIAEMPRFAGPYIFTTTAGARPVGAFSQAKERLDAAIGGKVASFVIHDFRRVVRSNLGRLKVPPVVAELCLGHNQRGIVKVYDQHDYFEEKQSALRQWEARLLSLVEPAPSGDKVVPIAKRRMQA